MKERGVDLDGALTWVATSYERVLSEFEERRRTLPSWGSDIDIAVKDLIERLGFWIRGHDCWSFESERYFGTGGAEIQKVREMNILPKVGKPEVTATNVVG
jgi:Delta6-protoilludene synthase